MHEGKLKRLTVAVESVCEAHGRTRVNGAVASERTFRMQMEVMKQFVRTLHGAGYLVETVESLGEKHINAVFDVWVVDRELSGKTLQNQKSRIKQFFKWAGKVRLAEYVGRIDDRYRDQLPDGFKATTVAERSKSWRGSEVDLQDLITRAKALDSRYAAMLMMERAFGLRKKEALLIKPWRADKGDRLELVSAITKNGRHREIVIRDGPYGDMQRRILDFAKSRCRKWESLAWPDLTFKQAEQRYYGFNRRIGLTKEDLGLTGHGLRAGHAEDIMLLGGVLPATMGGVTDMTPEVLRKAVRYDASRTLGHNREVITSAYIGSESSKPKDGASLGWRFGDPMLLQAGGTVTVQLWVSEQPQLHEDGSLTLTEEAAQLAYVTAQLMDGDHEVERLNVKQLVRRNRGLFAEIEDRLALIGLTLLAG